MAGSASVSSSSCTARAACAQQRSTLSSWSRCSSSMKRRMRSARTWPSFPSYTVSRLRMAVMRLARSADFFLPTSALPNISQTDAAGAFNCFKWFNTPFVMYMSAVDLIAPCSCFMGTYCQLACLQYISLVLWRIPRASPAICVGRPFQLFLQQM